MGADDLYLLHRPAIEQAIRVVLRRQRISADDAEDFASAVRLHLIDRDCAVLRGFQGRSSLGTYLLTVITHFCQDWRNARWGKWRPSAEARREGPLAIHLERLTSRDGLTFDEAYETLRTNFRVTESRDALRAMASRFPIRHLRRFVSDDDAADAIDERTVAEPAVEQFEAARQARVTVDLLSSALASLSPQDRLILKLRFEDGLRYVDVARALSLDDKPLYRRVERVLARLRTRLEEAGLGDMAARQLLATRGLTEAFDAEREIRPAVRLFEGGKRSQVSKESTR